MCRHPQSAICHLLPRMSKQQMADSRRGSFQFWCTVDLVASCRSAAAVHPSNFGIHSNMALSLVSNTPWLVGQVQQACDERDPLAAMKAVRGLVSQLSTAPPSFGGQHRAAFNAGGVDALKHALQVFGGKWFVTLCVSGARGTGHDI